MWPLRLLCTLLFFIPSLGWAFTLSPISQVLTPGGSRSKCSYQVTNTAEKPIAVEFWVAHLIKHVDGSEDLTQREDDDFAVFPPQLVLPPGATRTIRLRWLGDPDPERELSFRFMAEEVPVKLEEAIAADDGKVRASVNLFYKFHGTLFIRPKRAKPDVSVEEVELMQGSNGNGLRIRLQNEGTMRGWVREFILRLEIDDQTYELTQKDLPALENFPVLAGGHREVIVRWPPTLPMAQPSSATIKVLN
ncbi:MAG: molecular chaperone [Proteobacteria bacterium]|jgi:fimbrial chaperone protein|nr:molecular chaperone [Pseudomonadota bacterium]